MHEISAGMSSRKHFKAAQNLVPVPGSQSLHHDADVPHVPLWRMWTSHTFCYFSFIIIWVIGRQNKLSGILIEFILPVAKSQIGYCQQAGRVGIIHQIIVSKTIRLISINLSIFGMIYNTVGHDPVHNLLRQCPAPLCQFLITIALPADLLPIPKGSNCHHVGRDQIAKLTAVIGRPESGPGHARYVHRAPLSPARQGI